MADLSAACLRTRKHFLFMAKAAEKAVRYEEMASFMESLVLSTSGRLTDEERDLFILAYKRAVGSRRAAWLTLSSLALREESNEKKVELIRSYRAKIEAEIDGFCNRVLLLLASRLLPSAACSENKVLFLKMKGDYNRYLVEIKVGDEKKAAMTEAMSAYTTGRGIAFKDLAPSNPTRLGIALNFSVFYYDVLKEPDKAFDLAKEAFEDAMEELETMGKRDSPSARTTVLELLLENLGDWASEAYEWSYKQKDEV